jgi:hypothetical protein
MVAALDARVITLKPGITQVSAEYLVRQGDILRGAPSGSTLKASPEFKGRAVVVLESDATVENLNIDGNRAKLSRPLPIAPYDRTFSSFYPINGILSVGTQRVTVRGVKITNIVNFAVLVSAAKSISIRDVHVTDSGSLNDKGRNNTTGGILLEEGTTDFTVENCSLRNVRGNGVWTHSMYTSPRNARGRITSNRFADIGRDAIQIGHATEVRVDRNSGSRIGYPHNVVDMAGGGTPVAIDTAGNVDKSVYERNMFQEIDGKCIDLDGFHHGDVLENVCINKLAASDYLNGNFGIVFNNTNQGMRSEAVRVVGNVVEGTKFGGLFLIGRNHTIKGNRFIRVNLAGCNESHAKFGCVYDASEPNILASGIYLAKGAERPDVARENAIVGNTVTGFKMAERCIGASPKVDLKNNTIEGNTCRNQ